MKNKNVQGSKVLLRNDNCFYLVDKKTSQVVLVVKNPLANAGDLEMWIQSLGQEDPLEKGMAIRSSILAWRIPWTEEPGRQKETGVSFLILSHSFVFFYDF